MPTSYSRPVSPEANPVPFEVEPEAVTLPVCPRCGHTGKNPGASSTIYSCVGSPTKDTSHARTRMVDIRFFPDLGAVRS